MTAPAEAARRDRWRTWLDRVSSHVRRVIGAPDYDGYLRHHLAHHSGAPPLSREEFVRARFENRYDRPGARCC